MNAPQDETKLLLTRYLDGDLSETERRVLDVCLENDGALAAELRELEAIRAAVRHDTNEAIKAQDFDVLEAGLMIRLEEAGLVEARHGVSGLFDRLRWAFAWPRLLPAGAVLLLLLGFLLWSDPPRDVVPGGRDGQTRVDDCVVETVEAVNSSALVFEADAGSGEPVTVIWLFENAEKGDPS